MNEDEIRAHVEAILRPRNPHAELRDDLPLGANGFGLDSISLVEVLLELEDALGVAIAAEVLGQGELTVGTLVSKLHQARGEA